MTDINPSVPIPVVTAPVAGGSNASGSGAVTPNNPVPSGDPAAVAFNSANEVITSERSDLASFMVPSTGSKHAVVPHSSLDIVQALGGILKLAAVSPVYGALPGVSTAATLVDRIETGDTLITTLEAMVASLKTTNQATLKAGYAVVRTAYNYGKHNDQGDEVAQSLLAPSVALFVKRPRAQVAGTKAGESAVKQAKAQARSTKATAEATTAQAGLTHTVQTILGGAATAPAASAGGGNGTHTP